MCNGQYLLDVQNADQWQIEVRQPRGQRSADNPFLRQLSASHAAFELSSFRGLHRVEPTHQGDANFIVDLLDENGASVCKWICQRN